MFTRKIAVVQYEDYWRIVDQDGRQGEPLTYEVALAGAETLARVARWQGLDVDVLVHRGNELRMHLKFRDPAHVKGDAPIAASQPH
jgi:hypothetical protein